MFASIQNYIHVFHGDLIPSHSEYVFCHFGGAQRDNQSGRQEVLESSTQSRWNKPPVPISRFASFLRIPVGNERRELDGR
jgi:hypothetical protein